MLIQRSPSHVTAGICLGALLGLAGMPLAMSLALAQQASYASKFPALDQHGVAFGAYDPHSDFQAVEGDTIEHVFMPWRDIDFSTLASADDYASQRGRSLLITMEPWSWSGTWHASPAQLREAILSGSDDGLMANACKAIGSLKSPVVIRWAQEMDDTGGRYPWSGWAPADYIAAYRRVVDICRPLAPKARFMWSPEGAPGLAAYYPGNAYVDEIGLSIFGLQQYDHDKYGRDQSFSDILKPKYDRVSAFSKPICVAELGYSGDEHYNRSWAQAVAMKNPAFPRLDCVVYFDEREPHAWPAPYGKPDWRVQAAETN